MNSIKFTLTELTYKINENNEAYPAFAVYDTDLPTSCSIHTADKIFKELINKHQRVKNNGTVVPETLGEVQGVTLHYNPLKYSISIKNPTLILESFEKELSHAQKVLLLNESKQANEG